MIWTILPRVEEPLAVTIMTIMMEESCILINGKVRVEIEVAGQLFKSQEKSFIQRFTSVFFGPPSNGL